VAGNERHGDGEMTDEDTTSSPGVENDSDDDDSTPAEEPPPDYLDPKPMDPTGR
jgi:hypothetical protein